MLILRYKDIFDCFARYFFYGLCYVNNSNIPASSHHVLLLSLA